MGIFDGFLGAVAGPLVGGIFGAEGARDANEANAQQAQLNRDFQERMSNTAYQRAVADMRLAGLNPMLAYSQGGASTPVGGIGNPMINRQGAGAEAASKIAASAASVAQAKVLEEQVAKTQAETSNIHADTVVKAENAAYLRQQTMTSLASAGHYDQQVRFLEAQERMLREALKEDRPHWEVQQIKSLISLNRVKSFLLGEELQHAPEFFKGRASEMTSQAKLRGLQIPLASNLAAAQGSDWMRFVSPYLDDAGKVTNSAGDLARMFRDFSFGGARPWPRPPAAKVPPRIRR